MRKKLGDKNIIGASVTRVRKEKNLKQCELLSRLQLYGVTFDQTKLSRIEKQRTPVTDKELLLLAKALNISADALLDDIYQTNEKGDVDLDENKGFGL